MTGSVSLSIGQAPVGNVLALDANSHPAWQAPSAGTWVGTAAEYAAIATKDPTRLYVVTGP
jgi:hypothetical protein